MAFKYACFVSYAHGQYDLVKGFIDQLKAALKSELEPLLDEEVYIDEERLKPGYRYNEALALAICESVCMIVVHSPKYWRHDYCVREFEGMEALEVSRLTLLGGSAGPGSFIIPIVLRGDDELPDRISGNKHYANFSKFTLAAPDIIRNPEYIGEIRRIAGVIYDMYKTFRAAPAADPCTLCTTFTLPKATLVQPFRPPFVNR